MAAGTVQFARQVPLYERAAALAIIGDWIAEADAEIAEEGGALPPALEELNTLAEEEFKAKVESVALYITELEAEAAQIERHVERLRRRALTRARAARHLKDYLQRNMEAAGITKVDTPLVSLGVQKSPPSVQSTLTSDQLANIAALADVDEFITVVPMVFKLNARAVIDHWKRTGTTPIAGVTVTQGTHLRLR